MASNLQLVKREHYPHDEEDIYGEDHSMFFESGAWNDPSEYRSGIVTARVLPKREGEEYRATLRALWAYPPTTERYLESELETTSPIDAEQLEVAAFGLITTLERNGASEIDQVHENHRQAALKRSEG